MAADFRAAWVEAVAGQLVNPPRCDFRHTWLYILVTCASVGAASAAYLKFLHHEPRIPFRNFK